MATLSHYAPLLIIIALCGSLEVQKRDNPSSILPKVSTVGKKLNAVTRKVPMQKLEEPSEYKRLLAQGLLVDKSPFIKEIIHFPHEAVAIFRPRSSGKSVNLDMVQHFLRLDQNSTPTFLQANAAIMKPEYDQFRDHYMNRWPVIFIDLNRISTAKIFSKAEQIFYECVNATLNSFSYLGESENTRVRAEYKDLSARISRMEEDSLRCSIEKLAGMIGDHHRISPYIIIDDIDTPITTATLNGFLGPMTSLVIPFYYTTIKYNKIFTKIIAVGVTPINWGRYMPNNVAVFTVYDRIFGSSFGFTTADVQHLLKSKGQPENGMLMKRLTAYYNYFKVDDVEIFNPKSVMACAQSDFKVIQYATPTNSLQNLTVHLLTNMGLFPALTFETLLKENKYMKQHISPHVDFETLLTFEFDFWAYFVHAGLLCANEKPDYDNKCTVKLRMLGKDIKLMVHDLFTKLFAKYDLQPYEELAQVVQQRNKTEILRIMKVYLDHAGIYLFGKFPTNCNQVYKVEKYIELFMSDWMERFGKNITSGVKGKKVVLTFFDKNGEDVMTLGLTPCTGMWPKIKRMLSSKSLITRVENVYVTIERIGKRVPFWSW